jgi:hypothetical protein
MSAIIVFLILNILIGAIGAVIIDHCTLIGHFMTTVLTDNEYKINAIA